MGKGNSRIRADQLLALRNYAPSRSRARDMIARGCVKADGTVVAKAGALLAADAKIEIDDPGSGYVSRAALKLIAGLQASGFDATDVHALDLGASTGGFTQVLLQNGASSVLAIDVGHAQMVAEIADDPRVTNLEGINARDLTAEILTPPPELIVSDVSFISLRIAAEPALRLAALNARSVLLVKPQFEVGREGIGKGGLVTDEALVTQILAEISQWFNSLPGWTMTKLIPSPITGGDGNKEYLLCGERSEHSEHGEHHA
ncbi:MAG: TlyA family RNA methyltransferase [Rhizobiaceae bacterium]